MIGDQGFNLFARAALTMAVEKPLSDSAKAGLIAPYDSWPNRIAVHEFVQDIPLNPIHRSYTTLEKIDRSLGQFANHPMQLIWGMKDWCFTPRRFSASLPAAIPQSTNARNPERWPLRV